ncbi:serine hydrolase domain-containing protein [Pseudoxanthomonas sacheonensis]|uniref:CubicO group peptidase (Beta-lactamase class C family) n=1 Tax=Pseudoxanthomonas sacheonensis TaxID=443615 RepID=A0ABU1RTP2_9GAMM|nr:serine hydrolase domain-containing protein [Pseudoxanthomonas sacheonensis]MDR6842143.1 CubicO group peptidase (beta-lactamase class C family) [Pseudoxanthomonas sacheonensis]
MSRGVQAHGGGYAASLLLAVSLVFPAAHAQADERSAATPRAALEHGLRPSVLKPGQASPGWSLRERMAHYRVPGVAIGILKQGEVVYAEGFGLREADTQDAVDADTLFNVGSISKVVTAATSLRLVADGKLDLDNDVGAYLKTWRIPSAPGVAHPVVTLRMLMSHTSGLGVHGFPDFLPGEAVPTLRQSLDGTFPARNDPVRLQRTPGMVGDYSGGGTTVEQLVIEEVSGVPLENVARAQVFAPLGMRRSTFESPLSASRGNIAKAHNDEGERVALPRGWQTFPQEAAAGLWTSANELGTFVGALIRSYQGTQPFLPQALATQMMSEVAPSWHGLGPRLDGAGNARIFHHGGANDSYHAWIEGYLQTGDGFVILTNGENGWQLHTEIRNALSDAFGHGVNPPVRVVALAPEAVRLADYAGVYRVDNAVPVDLRRAFTDIFPDVESIKIKVDEGKMSVVLPDETGGLLALAPMRFIAPSVFGTEYSFQRDAHGVVRGVTVAYGEARAYFSRQAPPAQPHGRAAESAVAIE